MSSMLSDVSLGDASVGNEEPNSAEESDESYESDFVVGSDEEVEVESDRDDDTTFNHSAVSGISDVDDEDDDEDDDEEAAFSGPSSSDAGKLIKAAAKAALAAAPTSIARTRPKRKNAGKLTKKRFVDEPYMHKRMRDAYLVGVDNEAAVELQQALRSDFKKNKVLIDDETADEADVARMRKACLAKLADAKVGQLAAKNNLETAKGTKIDSFVKTAKRDLQQAKTTVTKLERELALLN